MKSNTYQQHTSPSVANHKNASHLSEKEKEALSSLMSNFEGLLKGTVGDYKKWRLVLRSIKIKHLITQNLTVFRLHTPR